MISFKQLSEKASTIHWKTWFWIGLGLAALPALRIYYVQEMLAALVGFSILFAMIYISVLAILLLVRGSKPAMDWAGPKVGRALHWSAETAESAAANPVWAKAKPLWARTVRTWAKTVPLRLRNQRLRLNENYRTVHSRFARLGPWAIPRVRRAAQWSAETGRDITQDVMASPAWAKAVWAKSLPHGFRRQQLKLNENCRVIRLRFAGLKPGHVYKLGLQRGGAVLAVGLRTHKRISSQVGNWLRQPVRYPDFIRFATRSRVRLSARTRARRGR